MGHYHIFFYSKANAPYFPGVGGWEFQLTGALEGGGVIRYQQ